VVIDPARRISQRHKSLLRPRNAVGVIGRSQFGYAFCRAGDFGLQPRAGLGEGEQVVIILPEPLSDSTGCCRFTVIGNDRSQIRMRPLCSLSTVSNGRRIAAHRRDIGSTAYSGRDFADALDLLASGRVDADALITSAVGGLDETDTKLRELHARATADIKVSTTTGRRAPDV
jgi:hypothetical protein